MGGRGRGRGEGVGRGGANGRGGTYAGDGGGRGAWPGSGPTYARGRGNSSRGGHTFQPTVQVAAMSTVDTSQEYYPPRELATQQQPPLVVMPPPMAHYPMSYMMAPPATGASQFFPSYNPFSSMPLPQNPIPVGLVARIEGKQEAKGEEAGLHATAGQAKPDNYAAVADELIRGVSASLAAKNARGETLFATLAR